MTELTDYRLSLGTSDVQVTGSSRSLVKVLYIVSSECTSLVKTSSDAGRTTNANEITNDAKCVKIINVKWQLSLERAAVLWSG